MRVQWNAASYDAAEDFMLHPLLLTRRVQQ